MRRLGLALIAPFAFTACRAQTTANALREDSAVGAAGAGIAVQMNGRRPRQPPSPTA